MPPKQLQLQKHLNTGEEWTAHLATPGLHIIDVHAAWCGQCKSVVSLFRRMKNELGDSLLHFSTAVTDTIPELEPYRNRSQPTFLLYANKMPVSVIHGADGPKLELVIQRELEKEHKIQDNNFERIPFIDEELIKIKETETNFGTNLPISETETASMQPQKKKKEFTIAIIKPDMVEAGKVEEILDTIRLRFIEILLQVEITLSIETAQNLYEHLKGEVYFEELIAFMTSGPSVVLLLSKMGLTGDGIVEEFRELIGPFSADVAKDEAPGSLRAIYGSSEIRNAIHSSSSKKQAARELAFFFPESAVPWVSGTVKMQKTLALIKPQAMEQHMDQILRSIRDAGFEVSYARQVELSREQIESFYEDQKHSENFETLVEDMTSGPVLALCLSQENAVEGWLKLLKTPISAENNTDSETNPTFASSLYMGTELYTPDNMSPIYGSKSLQAAAKDIEYFFPEEKTVAIIKPNAVKHRDIIVDKIKDLGFNVVCQKDQLMNNELINAFYKQHEEQEFYQNLKDFMSSGPSTIIVLSERDAVSKWRRHLGPTDPLQAKTENPNLLRGLFGENILANGLHGSSTLEQANEIIKLLFTDDDVNNK